MTVIPPDQAPGEDTQGPTTVPPINAKGEPRKSGPKGGRPRLSEQERAERAAQGQAARVTGAKVDPAVVQALSVLNTAYNMLATGLTLVGARTAASELSDRIPAVQEQNKQFLSADPKLAQRIAKIGASSGRAGFALTNLGMLVPVVTIAATELNLGAPKPRRAKPSAPPSQTDPEQAKSVFDIIDGEPTTPAASPLFPGGV